MTAKVKPLVSLGFSLVFFLGIAAVVLVPATAQAGVKRAPKNTAETSRSAECQTQPYTIFGITWINGVDPNDATDARWSESLSVAWDATTVDATMWSTAYNCPVKGETRYASEVFALAPATGGGVAISFPSGNSIYRGDSNPGEFTDPPGKIRVRLDVTGKGTGCHTVAYRGTYRDRRPNPTSPYATGASTTFFTSVCINRASPPDNPPTITATADCSAKQVRINVSDPDGGTATITYRIGSGANQTHTGNSLTINMSAYQHDPVTVTASTSGTPPPGGSTGAAQSTSVVYGASSSRGCEDRGFVVTASAVTNLNPDEESATAANFITSVTSSFSPPPQSNGMTVNSERSFYRIRNGATTSFNPSPVTDSRQTTGGTYSFNDTRALGGIQAGDQICVRIVVSPAEGRVASDGTVTQITKASNEATDCETVVNRPYMRVYGGDVLAGAGFAGTDANNNETCGVNASGTFISFQRFNGSQQYGSGVQVGAFSASQIIDFSSAFLRTSSPIAPKGLTFANSGSGSPSTTYGGGVDLNNVGCAPDFYATREPGAEVYNSSTAIAGRVLAPGEKKTIYVNGDAFIAGPITYANSGGYASLELIPSFRLVVSGNIYVAPSVGQLDGMYIAQPRSGVANSGRFYTCGQNDSTPVPTAAELVSQCTGQLRVNGAIVVQNIKPNRLNGTLRNAPANEPYTSGNIAESILYGLEVWGKPGLPTPREGRTGTYDAITALPPIL